ncbi:hypothetical protein H5410_027872 [Solanum commersonii]|uniref:DUF4283 domain-containing protein n=1 Tax=Solanum commersonii TaxID=4109 RepID=A0A9J5Z4L9_SOLCO|nr:hypothetical protein H5410_027872 [Solanum commersonii]
MAKRCKYTLVRKFINSMPKMEVIRKGVIAQTQLTGGVKIAHFNSRHIYIDLDNEADHITERPQHLWLGFSEKDPSKGKWQIRDEEIKKRKEMENNKKSEDNQNNQGEKNNQQQHEEKEQMQRKNKNHTQNHDQGKTIHSQEQVQQTKANHAQQQMQESGMMLKPSGAKQVQSDAQIPPPPTLVIVVNDHCVDNETLSPGIPFVVAKEVNGGRMDVKEKHTNMQEGEPKGKELSHVMHENPLIDHKSDLQTTLLPL